eukprot:12932136-Prorocentrum_lima.AAC.1
MVRVLAAGKIVVVVMNAKFLTVEALKADKPGKKRDLQAFFKAVGQHEATAPILQKGTVLATAVCWNPAMSSSCRRAM